MAGGQRSSRLASFCAFWGFGQWIFISCTFSSNVTLNSFEVVKILYYWVLLKFLNAVECWSCSCCCCCCCFDASPDSKLVRGARLVILLLHCFLSWWQDWSGGVQDPSSGGEPGEERVHHLGARQPTVLPWFQREPQRVSPLLFFTDGHERQCVHHCCSCC